MKKLFCLLLSTIIILTFFISCSTPDGGDDNIEQKYSISYLGVLDGEKIDLPLEAYIDNTFYPREYIKGEITQINGLKRYYYEEKDGVNYEISFVGWFFDEKCTKEFSFISKTTTGDLTIYAKLVSREIRTRYTITYKAVINNEVTEIPVGMFDINALYPSNYYKGDVVSIDSLLKEYQPNSNSVYKFINWYTTPNCDVEFKGITTSSGDMTIYAKINYSIWTPNA